MKFVCLGYSDEKLWDAMSENEREAMIEECFAYDDVLRRGGHWTGVGEALQSSRAAKTLRSQGGKVAVTDGPYAETKEQLGGLGVIEARDMEHAIELMSKHPGFGIDTHSQKNYRVIRMPVWCTESGRGEHCNKESKNETTAIPYRSQPRYCSHLCSEEAVAANAAGKTVHLHGFAPFTILL